MLKAAPDNAPWRPLVVQALAQIGGVAAPELSTDVVGCGKRHDAPHSAPR